MLKLPQSIIYAVIGVNLTGFAILLQLDLLVINSPILKLVSWLLTIAAWVLAYQKRNKYFTLF
jgi:hypothetical protein